jgi:hypothetical protein|tara:strand:+ start:3086 stop:5473 length:2388 start_codon:yes stop_codon:yes gene_type:complete
MQVTIFKDIKDTSQPFYRDVKLVLKRIEEGSSKELVKEIRKSKDKEERNDLKKRLPAICFSGKFNKRNDNSLIEHSGLICLDFDGYKSSKDLLQEKERLSKNKYIYSVFISPSGKGLKALVKIPEDIGNHKNYFASLNKYLNSEHFDTTSKNVSRVCYESYDPLIYISKNSSIWDKIDEQEYVEKVTHKDKPTIPLTDENKIVEILTKWWEKKYGLKNGERNNNVYILAASFNDFGVPKTLAEYVMSNFDSKDFNRNEILRTINSAYANTHNFGSKYYEDEEKVNLIKNQLRKGVDKNEIKCHIISDKIDEESVDKVITRIEEEQTENKFWTKSEKGVIKIIHIYFKTFLEDSGFYKFNPEGSKSYVFVRVINNLIDHTSEKEIKDFVLEYLLEIDDISVYNYFAEHTRYFREEFLTLLSSIDVFFIEDTKDTAYLYFMNCAVKITHKEINLIDYLDLGGYVWKDHVIDRDFTLCNVKNCDYKNFIHNICGEDESRISSMESTIGFLMHGYKNLSYCPATILNDEVISDNPEGGTGKGLFMNGLAKMKKLVVIDGKSFTFERSFAYQLVSADTQILCFDDVKKAFDFERLFSVVTEGLTLEKKNRDAIMIPFSKSPKIAITTNYAIKGKGTSFERRKWELELSQHYTKEFTPLVEFGKLMFGDWDDEEWCQFDNYMINCLQMYLHTGLVKSEFVNLKIRKLSAETCHEFVEWCGLLNDSNENIKLRPDNRVYKTELYSDFIEENPDFAPKSKFTISRIGFQKWLHSYCVYKYNNNPEEGRDLGGRWILFREKYEV